MIPLKQRECSTPASQNGIFMLSSAELISYISSVWIVCCLITTIGQTWLEKEKSLYSKTSLLEADVEMRSSCNRGGSSYSLSTLIFWG